MNKHWKQAQGKVQAEQSKKQAVQVLLDEIMEGLRSNRPAKRLMNVRITAEKTVSRTYEQETWT